MKRPTPRPEDAHRLEGLIAQCLELYEAEGPRAVDELLVRTPDSADLVRERLDLLGRMGLIADAPPASQPDTIGAYQVIGVLGRGGMGVVYEAEQERPRRRVALKVLRNAPGEAGLSRFQHEAELLARLQHPGIATIHEVGTAVVGGLTVPFFAMELVRGRRLDRYVAEVEPDVAARAELVAKIADAVHHAHQKGVVHRDLKPANVIVDERDEPRVLDFGVARATDPELRLETLQTEAGQLVGTLAYMSPEQAAGDPDEIDSQTDVYSLGVVAFELFAGCLPIDVDGRPVLDVLQAIRDDEPRLLGQLDRSLRGDLETIVAKALSKEKNRRYASAHELAADLRRFVHNEPITARPATAAYQLRKFARRNRALVAGAVGIVVALVLGLVGTLYGLREATLARDDAERRLGVADAVRVFQARMFARADPQEQGLRVVDLLDRSALLIEETKDDPLEEAAVRLVLGDAYAMTGSYEKAEPLLVRSAELFERELGASDVQTLGARTRLVGFLISKGRLEEAERELDAIVKRATAAHGAGHSTVLDAEIVRAQLYQLRGWFAKEDALCTRLLDAGAERRSWYGLKLRRAMARSELTDFERAAQDARDALDWSRAAFGENHPDTLEAMHVLGAVLQKGSHVEEGGALIEDVYERKRALLGPENPETLLAMVNAAFRYSVREDYAHADELLSEAYAIALRVLPPAHATMRLARGNLAGNLLFLDRNAEAAELLEQQLAAESELVGPDSANAQAIMGSLAMAYQALGRFEEAEELFLTVLDVTQEMLGDRHVNTLMSAYNLAEFYRKTRRYDEAEPYFRDASETAAEVLDELDYRIPWMMSTWALNLAYAGRFDEAEQVFTRAKSFADRLEEGHSAREKIATIRAQLDGFERR